MRYFIVALSAIGLFCATTSFAEEPETLTNKSVQKAGDGNLIRVQKRRPKTNKQRIQVLEDAVEPRVQQPTAVQRPTPQRPAGNQKDGFSLIDINGPWAPKAYAGIEIKWGPRSENGRSIKIVEFWATWCVNVGKRFRY